MAKPTSRKRLAFVYCWTDHRYNKLYVGRHAGTEDDGYIASSKYFLKEYRKRPQDFTRQIIAHCTLEEAESLEHAILKSVDAARDEQFYNKHNAGKKFTCCGHTEDTKNKMSETWKSREKLNCDQKRATETWRGQKHTEETKMIMSIKAKQHSDTRRERMKKSNPMRNPETIQKMLESRRRKRELRNEANN